MKKNISQSAKMLRSLPNCWSAPLKKSSKELASYSISNHTSHFSLLTSHL